MTAYDRRITPARPDLAAAHLRGVIDAPRYAEGQRLSVIDAAAPMRKHAAPDAPLETEALHGETVTVYDEVDGWAWGQLEIDGYVGYLPRAALHLPGPAATGKISALRSFLYPGPGIKLPPLCALTLGTAIAVTEVKGDFAVTPHGYIYARHISPLAAAAADFVAVCSAFLGAPYLWGGKTSLGLDCSALVQTGLRAAGIAAPRDADMQEHAFGRPSKLSPDLTGLRRGDLVFWKGHVGVMQDAEQMLHASGFQMAVVSEPLREAAARIAAAGGGKVTSVGQAAIQS